MTTKIEIGTKSGRKDPIGLKYLKKIKSEYPKVESVDFYRFYMMREEPDEKIVQKFASEVLCDPIIQDYSVNSHLQSKYDWIVEVDFKPGVTDNEGRTATEAFALFTKNENSPVIYSGAQFRLSGELSFEDVQFIADKHFANTLIQRIRIFSAEEVKQNKLISNPPLVDIKHEPAVITYDFPSSDKELLALSKDKVWALNVEELRTIEKHFSDPEVLKLRKEKGMPDKITDVEIECLAQSWSEHCKHKIFSAEIEYTENGKTEKIDGLFKTYIKGATEEVIKSKGDDFCLSVFKDNAGVISFNDEYGLVFKVETHNSPSALDPYGGALTGIVGVNRDPFGTGMGSSLLFNTNVFCLADPFESGEIPTGLLHPARVLEGVREGVEHGGNQSGIPTINGSLVFDGRYLGKPLVYCGTGGIVPKKLNGREGYEKYPGAGDLVVMCGGRIGIDGIHGATFSSEELHEESPTSAVQIGDPITQKRMFDFLIKARDAGLYSGITDNGAGGLSSSVGEMAQFTGGAEIDLAKAPLKYSGLDPWEILVSESQERMTLSVPSGKIDEFLELSRLMNVESTVIGVFTDSGFFEVKYEEKTVALLDMNFLHEGVPRMKLKAEYEPVRPVKADVSELPPVPELLHRILGRLNVASKEYWVRQYDHEVKGGSVIKPLTGAENDGPSDGAVYRPLLDSMEAVVVSHGIVPRYSDVDAGKMAENAFDEAVRNAVAVGGDPETFAALDNFCWPDPLAPAPDHNRKLSALVRANKKLYDISVAYDMPLISGKDSMKNDARVGDQIISVPPTLLVSLVGKIENAMQAQTMDAKNPGDAVYVIGLTKREMGHSELFEEFNLEDSSVPGVDYGNALKTYKKLHSAIKSGIVASCHDCSDGGLAVSLAETAFAGRLGMEADLASVPVSGDVSEDYEILFSESASRFVVTVSPEHVEEFEKTMNGCVFAGIGKIISEPVLKFKGLKDSYEIDTRSLYEAWKTPLEFKN